MMTDRELANLELAGSGSADTGWPVPDEPIGHGPIPDYSSGCRALVSDHRCRLEPLHGLRPWKFMLKSRNEPTISFIISNCFLATCHSNCLRPAHFGLKGPKSSNARPFSVRSAHLLDHRRSVKPPSALRVRKSRNEPTISFRISERVTANDMLEFAKQLPAVEESTVELARLAPGTCRWSAAATILDEMCYVECGDNGHRF